MTSYLRSFDEDFSARVVKHSDSVALIDETTGVEFSWGQLEAISRKLERWLDATGTKPGDVVISMLPNSIEALALFFACMRFGYGYAPLPPSSATREIQQVCKMVSPRLIVILADADERLAQVKNAPVPHVIKLNLLFDWAESPRVSDHKANVRKSGKLYMATSGSTGTPKLMVIDGNKLWSAGCAFVSHNTFLGAESIFYNVMPMSYLGGLFNLGLIPLACGGKTIIAPAFSGSTALRFWQDIMRFGVTILWLTPTMLRALVKIAGPRWAAANKSDLRVELAFLGTAPIDLKEKENFEKTFNIPTLENYGLSETTFITAESGIENNIRFERSVGKVLPWVELRVSEAIGELEEQRLSKLEARTPFLIDGYLGEDGAFQSLDSNDWFDTGDIGHFNNATLILDGRIRDIVKKGGILIHLPEVDTLMRQCPEVIDVATINVPHTFYGEDYVLFLVLSSNNETPIESRVTMARAFMANNLVQAKWPMRIVALDEIPRTRSGKVAKAELRKLAQEQQ
jgi:acyl-CoA synthetase (AMP-forming)/AMP-acid ligase II